MKLLGIAARSLLIATVAFPLSAFAQQQEPNPATPTQNEIAPDVSDSSGDEQKPMRDPTVPNQEILDKLFPKPAQQVAPQVIQTPNVVTSSPAARPIEIVPLPSLPKMKLRGIILSSENEGTALLESGDEKVSVKLNRNKMAKSIMVPERQFYQFQSTLDQIDYLVELRERQISGNGQAELIPSEIKPRRREYEIRTDSFTVDGVYFVVEDFSKETLILRAIPHDTLVLVR